MTTPTTSTASDAGTTGHLISATIASNFAEWSDSYITTPDSTKVVYITAEGNLMCMPINGGTAILIDTALGRYAFAFLEKSNISPDSTKVLYSKYNPANQMDELWIAPLSGGAPVRLDRGICLGEVAPDGTTVVYMKWDPVQKTFGLWVVPVGGGTPVKIADGVLDCSLVR